MEHLVSVAVEFRRSVVATSDNLGASSPASLPATSRSIPRIRPLRRDAKVTSLVLPGTRRPPGALSEVCRDESARPAAPSSRKRPSRRLP